MLNLLKRIRVFGIAKDIFLLFISSCGISFIAWFLSGNDLQPQQLLFFCKNMFLFLLPLQACWKILIRDPRWIEPNRWIEPTICISTPLGHAIEEETEPTLPDIIHTNVRRISAVHEAGHALAADILGMDWCVHMNGRNPYTSTSSKLLDSADDVKNIILMVYAGAAAEEITFGNIYSGCMRGYEDAAKNPHACVWDESRFSFA